MFLNDYKGSISSDERLQYLAALPHSISDAIIGTSTEQDGYVINSWNIGAELMYGWKKEEVLGKPARQFVKNIFLSEEDQKQWSEQLNTKGNWRGEVIQLRKDGSKVPVHVSLAKVLNENGEVIGAVAVNRDITELKETQEELAYQKTLLETVTENTTLSLFLMDDQQRCIYMNEAAEEMTGFNFHELKNRQLHYFIHHTHPDGRHYPIEECPIDQALPAHKRMQGEEVFVHKDGHFYNVAFTASPIIVNGNPVGTVIEVRDTTEEKKQQQVLRESEEQFRIFGNTIQNLAWMAEPKGDIFWYNDRWYEYTGSNLEEMKGWGWQKVHHPDHVNRIIDFVKAAWEEKEPFELTFPLRRHDGTYRWFLTRVYPWKDPAGNVIRWIGTNTDIDEQKTIAEKLESLVEERTNELAELNRRLEESNLQLNRSNADLQQFAHVASHDLKEPVRKIMTFLSRVHEEFANDLPARAMTYIEKMQSASQRMYSMIEGVLLYSSVNATEDSWEAVDLNKIIETIQLDLELAINQKQAVIAHDKLPVVKGSTILLHQLFYNLLNNSLKFSRQGVPPMVKINSQLKDGFYQIEVSDNGIGFDKEQMSKLFKPFSRLNAKDKYEGTGLGLNLCKRIVERLKGTISAEGELNVGAKFIIRLPAA
ncbi:MAG: PAS domain S-box protein [Candidatus Dadabacteria bacterium]